MMGNKLTDKRFWESFYAGKKIKKKQNSSIINRQLKKIFTEMLHLNGATLIEFGCGNSQWLPYFKSQFNCRIAGIDYSKRGLELLRSRLKIHDIDAELYEEDFISALPQDLNEQFDIASSFGVIEHFESPSAVLKIFSKVVKNEGIIITVIPKLTGLQGAMQKIINKDIFLKHNILNMREFIEEHRKAGFNVFFSSETGLITLGINFGAKLKLLDFVYRGYCKIVNIALKNLVGNKFVDLFKIGSSFLILSRKVE